MSLRLLLVLAGLVASGAAATAAVVSGGGRSQPAADLQPAAAVSLEQHPEPVTASPAPAAVKPLAVPRQRRRSERITIPHRSRAIGRPNDGRLEGGVVLPASGPDHFTWDGPSQSQPNPDWRRVGTDTLVTWLQGVLRYFRAKYPQAPRIGIGDLSLPQGGPFGTQFGGLGHASHQNGLDVDVMYPRLDRAERPPESIDKVDRRLSQALVNTFVEAGARFAFVGLNVGLGGPPAIVQAIPHHDDHIHVRINPLS